MCQRVGNKKEKKGERERRKTKENVHLRLFLSSCVSLSLRTKKHTPQTCTINLIDRAACAQHYQLSPSLLSSLSLSSILFPLKTKRKQKKRGKNNRRKEKRKVLVFFSSAVVSSFQLKANEQEEWRAERRATGTHDEHNKTWDKTKNEGEHVN